jgi:hypothetical protein
MLELRWVSKVHGLGAAGVHALYRVGVTDQTAPAPGPEALLTPGRSQ